jgi:hypothetical protein
MSTRSVRNNSRRSLRFYLADSAAPVAKRAPEPGGIVLFTSHLLHAVPPNPGERRIALVVQRHPEPARLLEIQDLFQRLTRATTDYWTMPRSAPRSY